MIDLVQLINKQELAVKPNKIVAGLEPENTNIFLQGFFHCFFAFDVFLQKKK